MRKKRFLAAILLGVSFCFVSGVGYGEEIPPEVLEVISDRQRKMIEEAIKKEAEPRSETRVYIDQLKEGGVDIIKMTETQLLQGTLDYIMGNPQDFLFIQWEWDWIGLFHVNHELPEYLIGKTEGKLVIRVFDSRNVFADLSDVALLEQFKKKLVRIYNCAPGRFSEMDRDVVALLYDYEGTPLSYFYEGEYRSFLGYLSEGEYHLWEE